MTRSFFCHTESFSSRIKNRMINSKNRGTTKMDTNTTRNENKLTGNGVHASAINTRPMKFSNRNKVINNNNNHNYNRSGRERYIFTSYLSFIGIIYGPRTHFRISNTRLTNGQFQNVLLTFNKLINSKKKKMNKPK